MLGVAEALRESIGAMLPPSYHSQYERIVAAARGALDEKTFAAAWAQGAGNDDGAGCKVCFGAKLRVQRHETGRRKD